MNKPGGISIHSSSPSFCAFVPHIDELQADPKNFLGHQEVFDSRHTRIRVENPVGHGCWITSG